MDKGISQWILEFILREPIKDHLANVLLSILPLPDDLFRLKKTILLRRIKSELSTGLLSERTLDSLQLIQELDYSKGNLVVLDSMKAAYCAVAVECTVKFLRENLDREDLFSNAVNKIWRRRIHQVVMAENVGLVSDQLKVWKEKMEAALWDKIACQKILIEDTRNDAIKFLRIYFQEAQEGLRNSFLEYAAQMMAEAGRRVPNDYNPSAEAEGNMPLAEDDNCSNMDVDSAEDNHEESSNVVKVGNGITGNKYDCLPLAGVNRVQEGLKSCSMEAALVKDPVPDGLDIAARVASDIESEKRNMEPLEENQNAIDLEPNCLVDDCVGTVEAKCNDNSVVGLPERSPPSRKYHLRSPKKRLVCPLNEPEVNKKTKRRKAKKWSPLEEKTLRIAVEVHGKGQWKLILNSNREIFEERTEHAG